PSFPHLLRERNGSGHRRANACQATHGGGETNSRPRCPAEAKPAPEAGQRTGTQRAAVPGQLLPAVTRRVADRGTTTVPPPFIATERPGSLRRKVEDRPWTYRKQAEPVVS